MLKHPICTFGNLPEECTEKVALHREYAPSRNAVFISQYAGATRDLVTLCGYLLVASWSTATPCAASAF